MVEKFTKVKTKHSRFEHKNSATTTLKKMSNLTKENIKTIRLDDNLFYGMS